ncbi:hypothetical protein CEXT_165591 [Caerostris extrusa]|uniref:Uncharacterized protein n=1 Tax=Caerostris extrusa TaxID=172846 RepID=A0AAV4RMB6_CAEEX|nr:hypothetical protein CEXT_165591 [Caerostris extrusa]
MTAHGSKVPLPSIHTITCAYAYYFRKESIFGCDMLENSEWFPAGILVHHCEMLLQSTLNRIDSENNGCWQTVNGLKPER